MPNLPPPNIGDTVNGLTFVGGDYTSRNAWVPARGERFLNSFNTINDQQKMLIRALANGELREGTQRGSSPQVQQLIGLAQLYNPDPHEGDASTGTRKAFISGTGQANGPSAAMDDASRPPQAAQISAPSDIPADNPAGTPAGIPAAAVQMLRANPRTAPFFAAKYGQGAWRSALSPQPTADLQGVPNRLRPANDPIDKVYAQLGIDPEPVYRAYGRNAQIQLPQPDASQPNPYDQFDRVQSDSALGSGARAALSNLTFGLADPAVAGLQSVFGDITPTSHADNVIDRYHQNLAALRGVDEADWAEHPVASLAGDVAGGFVNPAFHALPVTGLGSAIRQGVATGAGYGLGRGVTNDKSAADTINNMGVGALGGGLTGSALHGGGLCSRIQH